MTRLLLALLTGLVLLLTSQGPLADALFELVEGVAGVEQVDCCDDDESEEGDCCDTDFGRCCSGSVLAMSPPEGAPAHPHDTAQAEAVLLPAEALRPRSTGPPPTPPPIG